MCKVQLERQKPPLRNVKGVSVMYECYVSLRTNISFSTYNKF
jgi:hypothetical protein